MTLRRIREDDLELMLSWRNHPSVRASMFSQTVIGLEQHRSWFHRESEKQDSDWLLYINSDQSPAGVVYFTEMDGICSNAFWGFYAAPNSSPGTGTRMAAEALDFFFSELEFHKLNAEVLESNDRSHKFHLRLGFQVEGVFRDQYFGRGEFQSVTRYGLLNSEWGVCRGEL
jgi:UDP-4-amino-4,6-dideoxy-N-acetyl-beta-L-altrosamine N-acetyltransferase